jgi:hypothetical protein
MPDINTIEIILEYVLIFGIFGGGSAMAFLRKHQQTKYAHKLAMEQERTKQLELQAEAYRQQRAMPLKSEPRYTTAQVQEDGWKEMPYPPYGRGMQQQQGEE